MGAEFFISCYQNLVLFRFVAVPFGAACEWVCRCGAGQLARWDIRHRICDSPASGRVAAPSTAEGVVGCAPGRVLSGACAEWELLSGRGLVRLQIRPRGDAVPARDGGVGAARSSRQRFLAESGHPDQDSDGAARRARRVEHGALGAHGRVRLIHRQVGPLDGDSVQRLRTHHTNRSETVWF